MSTKDARAQIVIDATIEEVWRGLTDPEIVRRYFFGTELNADWREGGTLTFRGTYDGRSYEDRATIVAFEPPRLLRYSYWSNLSGLPDLPENRRLVSYELTAAEGGTLLTVSQDGVTSDAEREDSEKNWATVLGGLKTTVEGK